MRSLFELLNEYKDKVYDTFMKVFYYSYMPIVLYLGNLYKILLGYKSIDWNQFSEMV